MAKNVRFRDAFHGRTMRNPTVVFFESGSGEPVFNSTFSGNQAMTLIQAICHLPMSRRGICRTSVVVAGLAVMFHATGVPLASAANYSWNGSNGAWNSLNWTIPPDTTPVAGPTGASGTNTATIASGTVTFAGNDTFGNATISTSPVINVFGGTLASGGYFNTIWGLKLKGGTLLANGGANSSYPAFQLSGTVSVTGSTASRITVGGGSNNAINLGGTGVANTLFSVLNVTGDANADLTIDNVLQSNDPTAGLTKNGAGTLVITNSTT